MPLSRDEYIEQAFFFEAFLERIEAGYSTQEFLAHIRHELLTTTQLPLAIDFLLTDMKLTGVLSGAMYRLKHYFTPFQAFVVAESERESGRFDFRIALQILQREAAYRVDSPQIQGLFFYQFEVLCRNRLGYDKGIEKMMDDDSYDADWKRWLEILRRQVGFVDLADMVFYRSEYYRLHQKSDKDEKKRTKKKGGESVSILFGEREGRIAFACRGRDPVHLFSALTRHLGYPAVPRLRRDEQEENMLPMMQRRIEHLENRLQLLEDEQRQGINLQQYYVKDK